MISLIFLPQHFRPVMDAICHSLPTFTPLHLGTQGQEGTRAGGQEDTKGARTRGTSFVGWEGASVHGKEGGRI